MVVVIAVIYQIVAEVNSGIKNRSGCDIKIKKCWLYVLSLQPGFLATILLIICVCVPWVQHKQPG